LNFGRKKTDTLVGIVVSILSTEEWCTQLLDVVDLMVVFTFSAMFMF
jgi:hypothetical protein